MVDERGIEDLPVREGEIIAGKYRILRVLGAGGMGVVVAAYHQHLDEPVAIKFLHANALANSEVVARFIREARAAVKIKSEHVGRVLDVGVLDSGAPYIVMEYLEGSDLSDFVREHSPLPIEQAVEFVLQACEALAEAHALGIVHRDLKPANLFCTKRADGLLAIKVLDFGISKSLSKLSTASDAGMTKTNTIMGSPYYMSPEQMQSTKDVDARTDIWGLGVILYELLTGRVPFAGDTLPEICARVITQQQAPLREHRTDVPEELDVAIARCMAKSPQERYANVAEVAVALAPYAPLHARSSVERIQRVVRAAGLPESSTTANPSQAIAQRVAAADTAKVARPDTIAPFGHTLSRRPRSRIVAYSLVSGVLLACAAIGVVAFLRQHTAESAPASSSVPAVLTAPGASAATLVPPAPVTRSVEPVSSSEASTHRASAPASGAVVDIAIAQPPSSAPTPRDTPRLLPPKPNAVKLPMVKKPASHKADSDDPLGGQY